MADAVRVRSGNEVRKTAAAAIASARSRLFGPRNSQERPSCSTVVQMASESDAEAKSAVHDSSNSSPLRQVGHSA